MSDSAIGLCSDCQHCRIVNTGRSTFYLCQRSFTQPEYRRYPSLPVLRCPGYEAPAPGAGKGGADDKLTG